MTTPLIPREPVRFTQDDIAAALTRWREVAPPAWKDLAEAPERAAK